MLNNLPKIHLQVLQKRAIEKRAEATGDLFGNKIGNVVGKWFAVVKFSIDDNEIKSAGLRSNPGTKSTSDTKSIEILKRYISPEKRNLIFYELRLIKIPK